MDPSETALTGDRSLTHVRLRDATNYKIFDPSLLTFETFDAMADMGYEPRRSIVYHAEAECSADVQETLATCPMRVYALDGPPQAVLAFTSLAKFCSHAHNDMSASVSAAS